MNDFQNKNKQWADRVFADDPTDLKERINRFAEESLELQQSLGQTCEEAHQLVDYVFNRAIGASDQEMGGVMTTLALLALQADLDMLSCGERELTRVSTPEILAKIKEKRSKRHGRGALPGIYSPDFIPKVKDETDPNI